MHVLFFFLPCRLPGCYRYRCVQEVEGRMILLFSFGTRACWTSSTPFLFAVGRYNPNSSTLDHCYELP